MKAFCFTSDSEIHRENARGRARSRKKPVRMRQEHFKSTLWDAMAEDSPGACKTADLPMVIHGVIALSVDAFMKERVMARDSEDRGLMG